MASPQTPSAGDGQFERFLRRAAWRIRFERLRRALGTLIWVQLATATIWTAALVWRPDWALGAPAGLWIALGSLFLAADAALFWQIDRRRMMLRLDRQLGLADAAISSSELAGEAPDEWRRKQLGHTLANLEHRSWDTFWPRRWPRFTGLASVALIIFGAVLLTAYLAEKAAAQPTVAPFLQAQFKDLEAVFKDWDDAGKKFEDPELHRTLEELQPLREKMAKGQLTEKEAMVALSRVETKLEAARQQLMAKSLEPSAAELAAAFDPLQGMSAMSAALRRKDFGEAEKLAAEQADKLSQPDAKLPEGAQDSANQERMGNIAKNLQERGQEAAAQAMQQAQQGMKQGDGKKMGDGMNSLKQSFGNQAKRDAEKQRMTLQLAQMGQCKECLGNGQCLARGMSLIPKLANKPGGKGAGSDTDLNRFGAETQLASNRTEEKLTGQLGEGDSETTTEKTTETMREAASGARQAGFHQYEKLSREAIEDESIPLAHRQAIRKYFELIRPAEK